MPTKQDDRRQIDSTIKRYIITVAAGVTLAALGGIAMAIEIKAKVSELSEAQKQQDVINTQVLINTEAVKQVNKTLENILDTLEAIDNRQRQIQIELKSQAR